MKGIKPVKKVYDRICKILSLRSISWAAIVLFVLLLLPVCYLSFVNRATGDDYGYAIHTRAAWVTTHSLLQVGEAAWRTVNQYYYSWQGTWFSIFLFSLQPEVFSKHAYVIVAFIMLFLWIGSTFMLFKQILCRELQLNVWEYRLITIIFLLISIEFIPSTKSAVFWYNGAVHYMLPFAMCQLLLVWLLRYGKEYKAGYLIGITIIMTLLGGSNYQAALFALIAAVYVGIANFIKKKDKHIFWLGLPVLFEMTGLIVSMKAPGNKVRGGEDFGFSIGAVIKTIGLSFVEGIRDAVEYAREKPLVYVGLFLLFLIVIEAFSKYDRRDKNFLLRHPFLSTIALFCLYCAMQAPGIYADVSVSGGVYNTNFQVFLLCIFGIFLIIAGKVIPRIKLTEEEMHGRVVIPGIVICLIFAVLYRGDIKASTSFVSLEYIISGQAADFKEQMNLQTELLMDEETEDVVVPFINDVQGPLMHMPITADENSFTNWVAEEFYGKNSVVAIPRTEWNEKRK